MKKNNKNSLFLDKNLKLSEQEIARFCQEWKITKMSLFGSILREDFNSDSDIDILIKFDIDARQGLLTLAKLKHKLEEITKRPVDLVIQESIENSDNWIRKNEILNTAQVVYEQR